MERKLCNQDEAGECICSDEDCKGETEIVSTNPKAGPDQIGIKGQPGYSVIRRCVKCKRECLCGEGPFPAFKPRNRKKEDGFSFNG